MQKYVESEISEQKHSYLGFFPGIILFGLLVPMGQADLVKAHMGQAHVGTYGEHGAGPGPELFTVDRNLRPYLNAVFLKKSIFEIFEKSLRVFSQ